MNGHSKYMRNLLFSLVLAIHAVPANAQDMDGDELYKEIQSSRCHQHHHDPTIFFVLNTQDRSEIEVFNRFEPEKPVTVVSRCALKSKLNEILPDLVN